MKILIGFISIFLFYFFYGVFIYYYEFSSKNHSLKIENPSTFYDYRGVLNVRTSLSSGSSPPAKVITDGKRVGLDFLILTDLYQAEAAAPSENYDGYYDNMLVMTGAEYRYLDMRLIYLPSSQSSHLLWDKNRDLRMYFTDQLSQTKPEIRSDLLIIAHPFNGGPTWTGDFPGGFDGIEILNSKNIASKAWFSSKINVLWSLICYPFNPDLALLRLFQEPSDETSLWDKTLSERKIFGFAGVDVSAKAFPFASYLIKFPSYQKSFEVMTNHVLIETELNGNYQADRIKILNALKKGQFYFSLDLLGNPKGFNAFIQDGSKIYPIGSSTKFSKHLRLKAQLPFVPKDFYEIAVYKNGERDVTVNKKEIVYEIKTPGVYRVVVRISTFLPLPDGKKWISWIYTNPFFVEKKENR